MEEIGITEFYTGKTIFLTGGTGFMGKAFIEKLLRTVPDINKIYVLVRPKKDKHLRERLDLIYQEGVFDVLRKVRPGLYEQKVIPIAGDVTQLNLGISKEDQQILINEIDIVIHNAASVRFDDHVKYAVIINTRAAREMAMLSLQMKKLLLYIQVSTAFSNCIVSLDLHEKMYPPQADWRKMIAIAEKCDDVTLKAMSHKVMNGYPNTYSFSKHLAENCVVDLLKNKVPVLIARPTIVVAALKEPIPGWIDNMNGPAGVLVAYGKGIMRTLYCDESKRPDYIPVDVTIKSILVSGWDVVLRKDPKESRALPEILQISSYSCDWLRPTHKKLAQQCLAVGVDTPFNDILWTITGHTSGNRLNVYLRIIFFQLIPAAILDELIKFSGKRPLLKKITTRIYSAQVALRYFMNREWNFHHDKLVNNLKIILAKDFNDWDYDFFNYDVDMYVKNSMMGGRRYIMKEPDDTIPQAIKHKDRIYLIDRILRYILYLGLVLLAYKYDALNVTVNKAQEILSSVLHIK